ncbi:SH3 domain-containing protein [Viridibacillus sp. FSL R5-0477]|uniref:NLP/P60 protein n=1 Tax=Viridibacillus arenosi FSL R5-213 TaxID=1227360 RepID=W4F397_9BACL|nr:SH3 domain-containing protein [Viridibacillus arenosi]ETT86797.1 NLP/P60 protein [Viridibacillus arenosi FSL R5-213]OMC89446.1 hypothetical protein BK137_16940 [Viridibacillus arenosi]
MQKLLKTIILSLVVFLFVSVIPGKISAASNYQTAQVNVDGLNIRTGASNSAEIVAHFVKGDVVKYTNYDKYWAKTIFNKKTVYVSRKYLQTIEVPSKLKKLKNVTVYKYAIGQDPTVAVDRKAKVYALASNSSKVIGTVPPGEFVNALAYDGYFLIIIYKNQIGFVSRWDLQPVDL